jgi:CDP-2,3-bis-(O-geranylgeranyl)-sn-glycerol synthase
MNAIWISLQLLVLLAIANGSPIVAKRLLGDSLDIPIDGGLRFIDDRPLLGPSKTIRGVIVASISTAIGASVMGIAPLLGMIFGIASMAGDALGSFIKRRLGVASSGRAIGLDQIPEALLPLLVVKNAMDLSMVQILIVAMIFFVLEPPLARVTYRLGLRDRPY